MVLQATESQGMWINRAAKWLLPRDEHFFDMLERGASCARECGALLVDCCGEHSPEARAAIVVKMHAIEHDADRVIVEVYEALNKTFVTPIDRTDIYGLATTLESVVDVIHSTVLQTVVHAMGDLPPGSRDLAALIHQACEAIYSAVGLLRGLKNPDAIRECCNLLNRLESDGDRIFRTQVGEMFRTETDAIRLLKNKEFLEGLEHTLDTCDDVGNALANIIIKNA
jgi:uncharacterized protein